MNTRTLALIDAWLEMFNYGMIKSNCRFWARQLEKDNDYRIQGYVWVVTPFGYGEYQEVKVK